MRIFVDFLKLKLPFSSHHEAKKWLHHHSRSYHEPHHSEKFTLKSFLREEHEFRNFDGSENNPNDSQIGQTNEQLLRVAPPNYLPDGSTPNTFDRPNPRDISNEIFNQTDSVPNQQGASAMFWLWGQFLDHDIDLTESGNEFLPIPIPIGDVHFDPFNTGNQIMPFNRSHFDATTGSPGVPREQINEITPYIDASNVYGSNQERADFLRTFEGGHLKVSAGDLLPYNDGSQANAGGPGTELFLAGDVRANENVGLTSMHTLFVREHNFWADKIAKLKPHLSDENIYQNAKIIVTAEIESITFNEFLPLLLGENAIPDYENYDSSVDPQIANVFSTAAYRLGHTLISINLPRLNEDGSDTSDGTLALRDAFFSPGRLHDEGGVNAILRGFASNHSESLDALIIDEVRNFLFGPPGSGGLDLASLNIQRGRDHGLPDYNSARESYGLDPITEFSDITSDIQLQQVLSDLYGDVNKIDVFVGGLIEDPHLDSMLGELFHTIVLDQFTRTRDGDRFWYENQLDEDMIELINDTSLSDIIVRNTDIQYLQEDVMIDYERIGGTNGKDFLIGTENNDLLIGFNGKDLLFGDLGSDELFGGKGHDILDGGEGDDRLTGGQGRDIFIIGMNEGKDTITDMTHGKDKIDLSEFDLNRHEVFNSMSFVDGNTLIALGPGTTLTIEGINPYQLSAQDFLL